MDTGEKSGEAGAPLRAGDCQKTIPANHGAVRHREGTKA